MSWLYNLMRRGYESDSGYEGGDERERKRAKKEPNAESTESDDGQKKNKKAKLETDSEAESTVVIDSDIDFKPELDSRMADFGIFNQLEPGSDVQIVYIDGNNNEVEAENNNEVAAVNVENDDDNESDDRNEDDDENNDETDDGNQADDENDDESDDGNQGDTKNDDGNQGDDENYDGNQGDDEIGESDDGNQGDDENEESDDENDDKSGGEIDENHQMHQRENKKRKTQVFNPELQIPANNRGSSPKKAKLEINRDQEMHDDSVIEGDQVVLPLSEMPAGPSRVLAIDDVQNVSDVSRMRNFADSDIVRNMDNFGNSDSVMLRVDSDTAVVPSGDNVQQSDDCFPNVRNDTDIRAVPVLSRFPILQSILTGVDHIRLINYGSAANNNPNVNNSAQNLATDEVDAQIAAANAQNAANEGMEAQNAPDVSSDDEYFRKREDSPTEDAAQNVDDGRNEDAQNEDNAQNDAQIVGDLAMEVDDAVVPEMEHHLEQLVQLY